MNVYIQKTGNTSHLVYSYKTGPDAKHTCYLLSEVGERWRDKAQAKAEAIAAKRNCIVVPVEIFRPPWFVDSLEGVEHG